MISREYLTNLKKISKMFSNGMPLESFRCVDNSRVSMLEVRTNNHYGNRKYMFSELPVAFIQSENTVVIRDVGIEINNLTLSIDTECDPKFHDAKKVNINWDKTDMVKTVIDGKVLKGMIFDNECVLAFISDKKSTRVESQIMFDIPRLSYRVDKENYGTPIRTYLKMWAISMYKTIIPNRSVTITFGDEYPVMFNWEDDMGNEYELLVAPCMRND